MASSGMPPRRRWWYSTSTAGANQPGRLVTMAWKGQPFRSSKDSWSPARVRWRRTIKRRWRVLAALLLRAPITMVVSATSLPRSPSVPNAGRHTVAGVVAAHFLAPPPLFFFGGGGDGTGAAGGAKTTHPSVWDPAGPPPPPRGGL